MRCLLPNTSSWGCYCQAIDSRDYIHSTACCQGLEGLNLEAPAPRRRATGGRRTGSSWPVAASVWNGRTLAKALYPARERGGAAPAISRTTCERLPMKTFLQGKQSIDDESNTDSESQFPYFEQDQLEARLAAACTASAAEYVGRLAWCTSFQTAWVRSRRLYGQAGKLYHTATSQQFHQAWTAHRVHRLRRVTTTQ